MNLIHIQDSSDENEEDMEIQSRRINSHPPNSSGINFIQIIDGEAIELMEM
jgi:hypothetical protein